MNRSRAVTAPITRRQSRQGRPSDLSWEWLRPPAHARTTAGWSLLPLRAFLGFTFVFAGLQKLANPGFFDCVKPGVDSGATGRGAAGQPPSRLARPGFSCLDSRRTCHRIRRSGDRSRHLLRVHGSRRCRRRAAALAHAVFDDQLSLAPLLHGVGHRLRLRLDALADRWRGRRPVSRRRPGASRTRRGMGAEPVSVVPVSFAVVRRVCGQFDSGRCQARDGAPCAPGPCPFLAQQPPRPRRIDQHELDRRSVLAKGGAAAGLSAAVLLGGGAVAGLGRLAGGSGSSGNDLTTPTLGGSTPGGPKSASTTTTAAAPSSSTTTTAPSQPAGTKIGPASRVPVGGAASFQDPSSGDPSLVVQPAAGTFLAFDAVCPHAGCTVEYYSSQKLFVCPCHGSEFNGRTGSVEVGPAQRGPDAAPSGRRFGRRPLRVLIATRASRRARLISK